MRTASRHATTAGAEVGGSGVAVAGAPSAAAATATAAAGVAGQRLGARRDAGPARTAATLTAAETLLQAATAVAVSHPVMPMMARTSQVAIPQTVAVTAAAVAAAVAAARGRPARSIHLCRSDSGRPARWWYRPEHSRPGCTWCRPVEPPRFARAVKLRLADCCRCHILRHGPRRPN